MSYEAMYWDPEAPRPGMVAGLSEDRLSRYVEGWGRAGDDAVVARDEVVRIGAAWLRLFSADRPGCGFVDETTPELGIAVVANADAAGWAGCCWTPCSGWRATRATRPSA